MIDEVAFLVSSSSEVATNMFRCDAAMSGLTAALRKKTWLIWTNESLCVSHRKFYAPLNIPRSDVLFIVGFFFYCFSASWKFIFCEFGYCSAAAPAQTARRLNIATIGIRY